MGLSCYRAIEVKDNEINTSPSPIVNDIEREKLDELGMDYSFNATRTDLFNLKNERINEKYDGDNNLRQIDTQIYSVIKSVCKIIIADDIGTGFLIKLYKKNNKEFFCLMANEHLITRELIAQKEKFIFYYDGENERKEIILDENKRFIKEYTDIYLDITIIEILREDNIDKKYFLLPYIGNYNSLLNKKLYVVQFPEGKLSYCWGELIKINNYEIIHDAKTKYGSSGSPIFLENTTKIIAIHKSRDKLNNKKYGDFIYPIIKDLDSNNNSIVQKYDKKILYYSNGNIRYEGEFLDGKIEGNGKYYYENGSICYVGQFKNGLKHGKGILYFNKYNIKFESSDFELGDNGKGNNCFENNIYCITLFCRSNNNTTKKNEVKHCIKEKIKYEGEFMNDKFEGNGKEYFEDGGYYIGEFKNDFKNGKGIEYDKDGNIIYDGDYINNKQEGKGKYYYKNGEYYIGEFRNSMMSGKGIDY